jgi:ferritin
VVIKGFGDPQTEYKSLTDALATGLEHEKIVTQRIYNLMSIAQEDKDFGAMSFLNWYVDEQVEEESSFTDMIGKVNLVGEKGQGIYLVDQEAAVRVFTPPVQA